MRRLPTAGCAVSLASILLARQAAVDAGTLAVDPAWKSFARLKAFETLRKCLRSPLGVRARCAYCSDSRAADVDHFWPKTPYPDKAFLFTNMLFVCPECNRKKSSTFPLDPSGLPLLINPMFDDP